MSPLSRIRRKRRPPGALSDADRKHLGGRRWTAKDLTTFQARTPLKLNRIRGRGD
jgi:hypothetical protein